MKQHLVKMALAVTLVGCSRGNDGANRASPPIDYAPLDRFAIISSAFQDGSAIPTQYTCDGDDRSPPLSWGEPPRGTKSFALVVDDPDAPGGTFRHWGAWDIPARTRSIAAGEAVGRQAINGAGKSGYMGPCPPPGGGVHRYRFKLFALNADALGLSDGAKVEEVEQAAQRRALGGAELTGTFQRK